MFSLYFDLLKFKLFPCRTLVLITSVPGHCLSFTSDMLKGISLKTTHYFFYKFNYILKMYYLKQYNYINYINQLHHIKIQLLHICEKGQYQLHVNPTADKCLCFAA